jgi:hypothetical protein
MWLVSQADYDETKLEFIAKISFRPHITVSNSEKNIRILCQLKICKVTWLANLRPRRVLMLDWN